MSNENDRNQRAQETREQTDIREEDTFVPAGLIPDVKEKDGFHYRWIRVSTFGQTDASNVTARLREGYEPVPASEHPEIHRFMDADSRFPDNIEQGGLLLCRIPESKAKARERYYNNMTRSQRDAVDNNFMRENDQRMPLFKEGRSEVKSTS
jgi:hypothetical protein